MIVQNGVGAEARMSAGSLCVSAESADRAFNSRSSALKEAFPQNTILTAVTWIGAAQPSPGVSVPFLSSYRHRMAAD